jgi:3-isopropylmalate/(R)-2-methylmalate dehydratase small subunit
MKAMQLEGKAFTYGDNVNTDEIIPARYLNRSEPEFLAEHCMEAIDPAFLREIEPGDIIVAGKNFGCGSSREHAPIAIKAAGISCVIAETFARIFYRNSINIGLPIIECPEAVAGIQRGNRLRVDLAAGTIKNLATGNAFRFKPLPDFAQDIVRAGGLMNFVMQHQRHPH